MKQNTLEDDMTDSKKITEEIRVVLALIDQYESMQTSAKTETESWYYQGKVEGLLMGLGSLKRMLDYDQREAFNAKNTK